MSKFADAYKAGIDAGQQAIESIQEIDSVFEELDREISSMNGGKLSIIRKEKTYKRKVMRKLTNLEKSLGIMGPSPYYEEEISYNAIVLKRDKDEIEIAEYEMSETGYPITLKWSNREEGCWDKDALTETLEEILAFPATGKAVVKLLSEEHTDKKTEQVKE
jgi:hypothetical protein